VGREPPSASTGELRWVEAAMAGDRLAFERLYRSHERTVHALLLSMLPPEDARDGVQEVFLAALRSIATVSEPARFGAWLASIARNAARDVLRRRRPERDMGELAHELPEPEQAPAADDRDEAARILACLRELPEAYRESLSLRLVEGMGGPEIAARLGLTPGSVRVNLCRGMKLLRTRLAEEGIA
jgi:RNA polymerase sigma-70 factor (ECF subfamily)